MNDVITGNGVEAEPRSMNIDFGKFNLVQKIIKKGFGRVANLIKPIRKSVSSMEKSLKTIAKSMGPITKGAKEIPAAINNLPISLEPITDALVPIGQFIIALFSDPVIEEIMGKFNTLLR